MKKQPDDKKKNPINMHKGICSQQWAGVDTTCKFLNYPVSRKVTNTFNRSNTKSASNTDFFFIKKSSYKY